jgi:CHC2 zinc finger
VESYRTVLRSHGRRKWGRCPFHDENTASFLVDITNRFHCFGCGAHGSVIDFVTKRTGVSVREAVRLLADRYGIRTQHGTAARPIARPLRAVSRDDVPWLREQRRLAFEKLALRFDAVCQRLTGLRKRLAAATAVTSDPVWTLYATAVHEQDAAVLALSNFFSDADLVDWPWFWEIYCERGTDDIPPHELRAHRLRRPYAEGALSDRLEWLPWLQPAPAAVIDMVRKTMTTGEVADAMRAVGNRGVA